MKLPRWLPAIFLAFALLFAQQGAAWHAMSHTLQDTAQSQDQNLPTDNACDKCLAFAQVGSAVASGHPPFVAAAIHFSPAFSTLQLSFAQIALGYSSRAPPVLL